MQKMGEYVFHLERMLNEMKFFRQKKQETRDRLQNEYDVAEVQEAREQVLACSRAFCPYATSYTACKLHRVPDHHFLFLFFPSFLHFPSNALPR